MRATETPHSVGAGPYRTPAPPHAPRSLHNAGAFGTFAVLYALVLAALWQFAGPEWFAVAGAVATIACLEGRGG